MGETPCTSRTRSFFHSGPAVWIWLGFACTSAWPWSLNTLFPQSSTTMTHSMVFCAFGLAGLVVAMAARRGKTLPDLAVLLWGAFFYVVVSLWYALSLLAPESLRALYGWPAQALITLSGTGQALFFIRWIGAFGSETPCKMIVGIAISSVISAVLLVAVGFVPYPARGYAPLVLGVAAVVCYARSMPIQRCRSSASTSTNRTEGLRFPWKLAVTALVAGFAFGLQQNLYGSGYYSSFTWSVFGVGGFVLAAALFLLCALKLKMNFNRMIYQYSFVAMALGCVFSILDGLAGDWGYGLFAVGYRFFDVLLWSLGAFLIISHDLEPDWFAGICVGFSLLGRFAGFSPLPALCGLLDKQNAAFALALLGCGLLITALYAENRNNTFEAWGLKRPSMGALDERDVEKACVELAGLWGLTPREREILGLLVNGGSRRDVAQRLCISEETVKSHLSRLYQKSGLHTREELEERVKTTIEDLRGEAGINRFA